MDLNGYTLTDRHNRPSVGGRVAIRTRFYNNGAPVEPYDVSSVTIFSKLSNAAPSSIVDAASGIIKPDQPISTVLMNFAISGFIPVAGQGGTAAPHDAQFDNDQNWFRVTENYLGDANWFPGYVPGTNASGIYRTGVTGEYVAVLDGTVNLSGAYGGTDGSHTGGTEIKNDASTVQDYIDVWTVKMSAESNYQLFINTFKLFNDNYLSIPEPLLLTASNRLINKHVTLGSTVNLKITTDMTVHNKQLTESVKNILQDYSIQNPSVLIQKINEGSLSIPSHEEVLTAVPEVTSDNTMIVSFTPDADNYETILGGALGTYSIVATYNFLTETITTPPFYFTVS